MTYHPLIPSLKLDLFSSQFTTVFIEHTTLHQILHTPSSFLSLTKLSTFKGFVMILANFSSELQCTSSSLQFFTKSLRIWYLTSIWPKHQTSRPPTKSCVSDQTSHNNVRLLLGFGVQTTSISTIWDQAIGDLKLLVFA
jgi:hypothetical protein